jgi:hypothetical protein
LRYRTARPDQESRLLHLPAELRTETFKYVLGGLRIRLIISMDPTRCLVECQSLDPREPCGWRHPAHFLALTALNEFYDFSANFVNAVEGKHLNAEQLGAIQKLRLLMELTDFERRPIPNSLRAEVSPKPQLLRMLGLLRDAKSLKHATIGGLL